jgi:hypothetical protein
MVVVGSASTVALRVTIITLLSVEIEAPVIRGKSKGQQISAVVGDP